MLVLGVGNRMMGDDAFGPLVVERLRKRNLEKKITLWSGESPESYLGKFRRSKTLVIIDTARLGKEPGTVELVDADKIKGPCSTHKIPLSLIIKQLKPKKVYFIAAQPKSVEFGAGPSQEIKKAVEKAVEMFEKLFVQDSENQLITP